MIKTPMPYNLAVWVLLVRVDRKKAIAVKPMEARNRKKKSRKKSVSKNKSIWRIMPANEQQHHDQVGERVHDEPRGPVG